MSRVLQSKMSLRTLTASLAEDRRGVSAVVTAIALTVMLGFCGLAVDVVMWQVNQRGMQGAADQAAIAGAVAYRSAGETGALGSSTTAQNAAYATAIRNGYPAASVSVVPFNNGGTCTNNGCLQVAISQPQTQYFTGLFFSGGFTAGVSAVGTCSGCGNGATVVGSNGGDPCVMALDASGRGVITDTGGGTLNLSSCNLYNNAPNTDATIVNNNGVIEGCGSTTLSTSCSAKAFLAQPNNPGGIDVPVVTNAAPAPDPYANVSPPTVAASCTDFSAYASPSGSHTNFVNIPSGTYCPGNLNGSTVTFQDNAVIVINQNNGLDTHGNGNSSISGNGVMIYIAQGGGSINANTTLNISAPTTGQYAGLALWFGDSSNVTYNGSNSGTYAGAIYAPTALVSYSGNGGSTSTCTRLIAGAINLAGGATASFNNSGCTAVTGPVLTASGVSGTTPYTGSPMLVQ